MVNASLPRRPEPESATWIGAGPCAASEVEMPNKPERRRNGCESAGHARRPGVVESVLAAVRADPASRKPMLAEILEDSKIMMQQTNLSAKARVGRSPRSNAARSRLKDASETTEGTREPQESWRSPADATDEARAGRRAPILRLAAAAGGDPDIARHYPFGPDFAEMRQRSRQHQDRSGGQMSKHLGIALAIGLATTAHEAQALDEVTFGTNWKAQAEHGGFYQAVAEGIYEKYGLDVTIRPGGPQVNHSQLLAAGTIDFNMGGGMFGPFNYVQNDIPMVAVAAMFQKDPQILMAHPDQGFETLADLKGHPILISQDARTGYWEWLKTAHGFTDDQIRPYTFNPAPFLADKSAIQQGYVTSEPFAVEREGGFTPKVFLLADAGYNPYSTVIETSWQLVEENPDLVQRFVDGSIEGWYSYLYGDPSPANALIKKDNPEMTDEQIAYSIEKMKEYGIVDSGDALDLGIGAMTDERWRSFFDFAAGAGLYPTDLDLSRAYTTQFVNKKVGMDLKG
jgi:NitT/TauT family transport system substrate-binding protein